MYRNCRIYSALNLRDNVIYCNELVDKNSLMVNGLTYSGEDKCKTGTTCRRIYR